MEKDVVQLISKRRVYSSEFGFILGQNCFGLGSTTPAYVLRFSHASLKDLLTKCLKYLENKYKIAPQQVHRPTSL